ncbi:cell wall hydrolase [Coprococcus comes]|uniref:cell wall hydrolase n=1 Tax=Coprococcus comes TaxID=410072 RepID=UPI002ED3B39B
MAVASVIMNRVKSDKFPNTIFEVLIQPGQYAFVNDEIIWGEPDERAIKNAEYVYWNGSQISENVLFQAEFLQGSGVWKQIDNQYFCYE